MIRCCVASGAKVPYQVVDRRPGDTIAVWAATDYAEKELGWKAKLGLTEMCRDQWAWAKKYPKVRLVGKGCVRVFWGGWGGLQVLANSQCPCVGGMVGTNGPGPRILLKVQLAAPPVYCMGVHSIGPGECGLCLCADMTSVMSVMQARAI
jgi:hypothetical protein